VCPKTYFPKGTQRQIVCHHRSCGLRKGITFLSHAIVKFYALNFVTLINTYIYTFHSRFILDGASQVFLRDAHALPKCLSYAEYCRISGGSATNPLVAFYNIYGKGEVLFFVLSVIYEPYKNRSIMWFTCSLIELPICNIAQGYISDKFCKSKF
jgi:hypothetical protein